MNYASWSKRIISYLIDGFLIYWVAYIFISWFHLPKEIHSLMINAACIAVLYFSISLWLLNGQTIFSKMFGIRVVSEDGSKLTLIKSIMRGALMSVPFIPDIINPILLIIFILSTIKLYQIPQYKEKRQTALDQWAKTLVINFQSQEISNSSIQDIEKKGCEETCRNSDFENKKSGQVMTFQKYLIWSAIGFLIFLLQILVIKFPLKNFFIITITFWSFIIFSWFIIKKAKK